LIRASLQEMGGTSQRWQIGAEGTLIGRDVGPNGVLIEDALASREHAEIRFENGVFVLCDLGATNPTLVNGEECSGRCQLRTGDELTIGGTTLVFKESQ
jgi:pSer/pThr/pTyr-binding forkhead associated (FHA) protein